MCAHAMACTHVCLYAGMLDVCLMYACMHACMHARIFVSLFMHIICLCMAQVGHNLQSIHARLSVEASGGWGGLGAAGVHRMKP